MSWLSRTAGLARSRNELVRPADRAEGRLVWLAALLMLIAIPIAGIVGAVVHSSVTAAGDTERQERTVTTATLRTDAPLVFDYSGTTIHQIIADAWWRGPDGRAHSGPVPSSPGLDAGDTIDIWVDRAGNVVDPPRGGMVAIGEAVAGGLAVLVGAALIGGGGYGTARLVHIRRSRREWERQWRTVEPRWSGRMGREPA